MSTWNFRLWLEQTAVLAYDEEADRRSYLPIFAENLTELLRKFGYVLDHRWNTGSLAVARWIYKIHCDNTKRCPRIIHRNYSEDRDQFNDTITEELLEQFISPWTHIPDFNYDTKNGKILLDELQNFIWAYIDLDESPQGRMVAHWLEGSDTESDDGTVKVDTYLQDLAAGWH